jgi:hypothetical protein
VTTPERFDPSRSVLTGLDVLDHGLPEPPGVLAHTMSVPMAFWTTANCAVVLFLRYSEQPDQPWVVCLEQWSPYQINALDHAGAVIGSTQGPPTLPSQRTAG